MDSKHVILCITIILMMVCCVSSDFAQDKKQCQAQLVSLSPCVSFVSGEAKAPSPSCCSKLKKDAGKSQLCLCILVKDRNEPDLGFKLNVTLALSLLSICQIQDTNATVCPELLHLAPNSPEAQVFKQSGNYSASGTNTSPGDLVQSSGSESIVKGLRRVTFHGVFLVWVLLSVFFGSI